MIRKPVYAAGGIVVRTGHRSLIAVVQRSKDDDWVLPRGKLKRGERAINGARREVVEETGFSVKLKEYLGAITYRSRGRPKVVEFWSMRAGGRKSHELTSDILAVKWLSLTAAIHRLSYPLERLFLKSVGRRAISHCKGRPRRVRTVKLNKSKVRRR